VNLQHLRHPRYDPCEKCGLEKVVADYNGAIALAKVEVDEGENMKIAGRYQVRGFPTVILFQNGEEKARFSGSKSIVWIQEFIENNI
jgi:thioredoxin 1